MVHMRISKINVDFVMGFEDFQKTSQFDVEFLTITFRIFDGVVTDFRKMKDVPVASNLSQGDPPGKTVGVGVYREFLCE